MDVWIVRYAEIGLKGKNRYLFEDKLINNIRKCLSDNNIKYKSINKIRGRIIVNSNENCLCIKNVFGVASISPAIKTSLNLNDIKMAASELYSNGSFKISAKRIDKGFKLTSNELNEVIGEFIVKKFNAKVNLENPNIEIGVEITKDNAFLFNKKIGAFGGLPVGISGKVLSFLSGGIDSPVAAFLAMKRGCSVIFVHFHNDKERFPDKIIKIIKVLNKFQFESRLYTVPFFDVQKEIIKNVNAKLRIIILRRLFIKIAREIMKKDSIKAIITGDSLGQVASQTLENLSVINENNVLILRPLIGYDKQEIVDIAKNIGTYDISIEPYNDCCSFLLAKHPETRARLEDVKNAEKNIKYSMLKKALDNVKVINIGINTD